MNKERTETELNKAEGDVIHALESAEKVATETTVSHAVEQREY